MKLQASALSLLLCVPGFAQTADFTRPATRWVNTQPDVPFLPKPATRPADWLVEHPPVVSQASPEAKALLHYLYSISGHYTLTGQHNFPNDSDQHTQAAARYARKTPVIYGVDWGFAAPGDKDSAYVRQREVEEIEQQWRAGSIIAMCWHEVRPIDDEPVTFMGSIRKQLTDAEFEELLTPSKPLHAKWEKQLDEIVPYLKQLEAAHVPILFRPCHEINGNWFWWNGRRGDRGSKTLYRLVYDRMVNVHHLTNLIWVWNVDQPSLPDRQFVDYFPGQDVVDVLTLDDYAAYQQRFYDELNALSDGKVMAIAETGMPPAAEIFDTQPKWAYYMIWAGMTGPRRQRNNASTTATSRPSPTLPQIVASTPRYLGLQDQAYWESINSTRKLLGLSPGKPFDAPPAWTPSTTRAVTTRD